MGFWQFAKKAAPTTTRGGVSFDLLHKQECNACPLNKAMGLRHPHMEPSGSDRPTVYMLGGAPGKADDQRGTPFSNKASRVLKMRIPDGWSEHIRWNNCIRTKPPSVGQQGTRAPTQVELECCRPSIVRDIEAARPRAIFGFGPVPLDWAIGQKRIANWCGRRIPVKIGNHTCWFFPMMDPDFVEKTRKFEPRSSDAYGSEIEFAFAKEMERAFESIDTLPDPIIHTEEMAFANTEIVTGGKSDDLELVRQFLKEAADEPWVGFDYETSRLRPYFEDSCILTIAVARPDLSLAFAYDHPEAEWSEEDRRELEVIVEDFIFNAKCRKVSHHLAFELEWSGFMFGRDCVQTGTWEDTVSQAYILDERSHTHSLDALVMQYFGLHFKMLSNLDRKRLAKVPLRDVLGYNAVDAKYHLLLFHEQDRRLADEALTEVYEAHLTRVPTLTLTTLKGIPIDQPTVLMFYEEYLAKRTAVEAKIKALPLVDEFYQQQGYEYRPAATADVTIVLRDMLKVSMRDAGAKTKDAEKDTTREAVLNGVKHPIARLTVAWRKHNKNISTYIDPVRIGSLECVLMPDGLAHPNLSTTTVRTWRTSSDDPNIQNWPKRVEENKRLRKQVKPKKGQKVVSFDFGQIQARNVAMESRDPALVKFMFDRFDIHGKWTWRIAEVHPQWVPGGLRGLDDEDTYTSKRNSTKNEFVFPLFFGAVPWSIARYLKIPQEAAEQLSEEFWDEFPDIHKWQGRIFDEYRSTGYVTGLSGFRRRAPISPNQLINAPIQADEALIVCNAMTRLSRLDNDKLQASMEIHDDLTFIWEERDIDTLAPVVIEEMLRIEFDWINVPLVVEMAVGDDWYSMKKVGVYASDTWNKVWNQEHGAQK